LEPGQNPGDQGSGTAPVKAFNCLPRKTEAGSFAC